MGVVGRAAAKQQQQRASRSKKWAANPQVRAVSGHPRASGGDGMGKADFLLGSVVCEHGCGRRLGWRWRYLQERGIGEELVWGEVEGIESREQ